MAVLLTTHEAHAGGYDGRSGRYSVFTLGFDLDYSAAISNRILRSGGGGGAFRLGYVMQGNMVTLIPEMTIEFHTFGSEFFGQSSLIGGKFGGRVRFLAYVEPGAFVHAGGGSLEGRSTYSHGGPIVDAGLSLDFTFLPMVDFGFHYSWNRIFGGVDSGVSYTVGGFNIALTF